ncbi:MAG: translocation/assembly module TamB domain-containing protein [Candidatus Thiodiazotropha sp. 6PLUC2]
MIVIKRIALALGGLLGLLLLLTLSLLIYIGSSQEGTHRVFDLLQKVVPGELSVTKLEGRLAGPLMIKGLAYRQNDGLVITNDRLSFDWRPSALFKGRLEIIELGLSDTTLTLPESQSETAATSEPYEGVSLPLGITIEQFVSDSFQVLSADSAEPIVIDHLDFKAAIEGDRLHVDELSFDGLSAQLSLDGSLGLDESLPLSLNLDWRYRLPDGPVVSGEGEIQGDAQKLQLHQQLAAPLTSVVDIDLRDLLGVLSWQANWKLEEIRLVEFIQGFPAVVKGSLSAQGDLEQADLDSSIQLNEPTLGALSSEVAARYSDGQVNISSLKLTNPQALLIEAQGLYRLQDKGLSAQMKWQQLSWPLNGERAEVRSKQGSLNLLGRLDNYDYQLAMDIAGEGLPVIDVNAQGNGDLTALALEQLALIHEESRIEGRGRVGWSPDVTWQMTLNGERFNPGLVHQAFPGQLAFELSSEGSLVDEQPQAVLLIKEMSGILRDYPVEAKGEIRYQQGVADVETLSFSSGPNQIDATGEVGDKLALDWSITAPDLAGFWPGLSGELNAEGKLSGESETPALALNLKAREIAFQTFGIEKIDAVIDLNLAGKQPVNILLDGAGLVAEGKQWDSLKLEVDGTLPEHKLNLAIKGDRVPQIELATTAGLDGEGRWQGLVQQLIADSPELGAWQLREPAEYLLGSARQYLKPICLVSGEGGLCTSFVNQSGKDWKAEIELTEFDLKSLQSWLPDETALQGNMGLEAGLSGSENGEIQGLVNMTIPTAGLKFIYGEQNHIVDFSGSKLTANLDQTGANAVIEMPLQDLGGINGRLLLPGLTLPEFDLKTQPVEGKITGAIENLTMVSSLLPKLQNSSGNLAIDFDLAGMLAEPRLKGQAKLAGGASDIPELGIELRDINLLIEAVELDKLKVTGEVSSGKGRLSLQGTTLLNAAQGFPSEYKISGKDWLAVDIPEAEVQLSPNIVFTHQQKGDELKGQIKVPYARLRPRELPQTAVSVSSDMVVKQVEQKHQSKNDAPFNAEIRLSLGKRVSFDGFGLRGNFTGNLLIIDEPGRPVLGRGRLGVVDGVYQAYGQDLKIERGYALFADSPVDNPGINVRAVREVDDVTAGLRVSGTLKKPNLDLFSTPAMSESDVLTYILTGRPPGESSGQTVGLAAALKASGASNLASELGRRFGLEEFRLDTGSTLEEAAFVAGTYLSPKLYVQYINELSSSESKMRLRYDLTDRWQLEAETGKTQAGDFFYTFER